MPNIAALHPQIVHFVVALIVVGVAFRWVSLVVKQTWLPTAAAVLIALGAGASALAVRSGLDAHGPVERVPGARPAVVAHEEWGERARNAFLLLLVFEVVAAALAARQRSGARTAGLVAAIVGLGAVGVLYRAADAGGELVYSYAGGVGIRSGDPADVNRLLVAAAHHQAALDRQSGKLPEAAALMEMVAARFPEQLELQLAQVESVINDRKAPQVALQRLDAIHVPTEDVRMRVRAGLLRSSALAASGDTTSARQVLETLKSEFPTNPQIQRRLAELSQSRP
jgi:uncharacterized membrane protein